MRAVLDPNIYISAVLSKSGPPARVVSALFAGEFDAIASQGLLDELERALAYPKLRARVPAADADAYMRRISELTSRMADTDPRPDLRSRDPADDYLLALAHAHRAALVTGDKDLLELADSLPIFTATGFLELLERGK